jgi:RNA polymerase sigma-70 factor (ECF subfamily)
LLVEVEDRPAKLAQYTGRGSLRSWLWVVLARNGRRFKKRERREETLEDAVAATLVLDSGDPELEYIKAQSLNEFRAAFRAAVNTLTEEDRDLLRRWLVEGATLEEVASSHGIHRVTAVRWLNKIRRGLLKNTRLKLGLRLGVGEKELESVINVIQSRLDVSFADLLVEEATAEESGEKEGTM